MARYALVALLFLQLCLTDVQGTIATGASGCDASNACTNAATTDVCEGGICKIKDGQSCASNSGHCVANAACGTNPTNCACNTGYTAAADGTCESGAAGVTISLALLVAAFVTSRFL